MSSKYNPFLQMVPDGEEAGGHEDSGPADLAKAVETAMKISEMVSEADTRYSRAAVNAARLASIGNLVMDELAQTHGITVADYPDGDYAKVVLGVATPEQLMASWQALNQAHDLALYAFLEAYKTLQMLLSHPAVEMQIAGMGTIKRIETARDKRKVKLMTQLQSPRESKRAELLAVGLTELTTVQSGGASMEQLAAATSALFDRVQAEVKDLPRSWPKEDEEDAAHG